MKNIKLNAEFPFEGLTIRLSLFSFIESDVNVVYSPALDIYGYGNDESEARESFGITLKEYIKYTKNKKTLEKDLLKYGCTVDKKLHTLNTPKFSELLDENESFRNILDNKPFKKFDMNVNMAALA